MAEASRRGFPRFARRARRRTSRRNATETGGRSEYVTETYELWTPNTLREHTYEVEVRSAGSFTVRLDAWRWDDNDWFLVELRDARTGATLVTHRNCDGWAAMAGARCDSEVTKLPVTFSIDVTAGQKVQLHVRRDRPWGLGFTVTVRRPQ